MGHTEGLAVWVTDADAWSCMAGTPATAARLDATLLDTEGVDDPVDSEAVAAATAGLEGCTWNSTTR